MGEIFKELIPAYIEGADSCFNSAMQSINDNDLATAERLFHSLKSSSRNLGAEQLGDLAETLEQLVRDQDLNRIEPVYNNAEEMYQHVRKELLNFKPAS